MGRVRPNLELAYNKRAILKSCPPSWVLGNGVWMWVRRIASINTGFSVNGPLMTSRWGEIMDTPPRTKSCVPGLCSSGGCTAGAQGGVLDALGRCATEEGIL